MIRRIILVSALCLAATPSAKAADFADDLISLTFSSKSISKSVTEGGNARGPALALLKDDTVLLGGGRSGGEILTWNKKKSGLRSLGSFIPSSRR